jgi:hypothetical protein
MTAAPTVLLLYIDLTSDDKMVIEAATRDHRRGAPDTVTPPSS